MTVRRHHVTALVLGIFLMLAAAGPRGQAPVFDPQHTTYPATDIAFGAQLFTVQCTQCHFPTGDGVAGVNLRTGQFRSAMTDTALTNAITNGVPARGMPSFARLNAAEIAGLVAYIRNMNTFDSQSVPLGDVTRGRDVFEGKGACTSCHSVDGRRAGLAPDLGIVGKDVLWESAPDVYELLDLDFGGCRMVYATRAGEDPTPAALEHLGLDGCPKVSGQRGIQVWVPVAGCTFAETRAWVEKVSRTVGQVVPELVSWKWHKANRSGKARLDYTQNAVNKTLVAPYSVRAAPGAPVSMPITWDELDDPDLRPDRWTILDAPARLLERGDLFTPALHPSPGPLPDL